MAVAVVVPLHRMIYEALELLREARADGPPDHNPRLCSGACKICISERQLNRLVERVPRSHV